MYIIVNYWQLYTLKRVCFVPRLAVSGTFWTNNACMPIYMYIISYEIHDDVYEKILIFITKLKYLQSKAQFYFKDCILKVHMLFLLLSSYQYKSYQYILNSSWTTWISIRTIRKWQLGKTGQPIDFKKKKTILGLIYKTVLAFRPRTSPKYLDNWQINTNVPIYISDSKQFGDKLLASCYYIDTNA